jgi:hypothetical protein
MTRKDLIIELQRNGYNGTIDRLNRGLITDEQAENELNGNTAHLDIPEYKPVDGVFGLSWEQIEMMQGGKIRR